MKRARVVSALALLALLGCACIVFSSRNPCEQLTTRFAAGFSSEAFERLRSGDELSVVTNALGPPLDFSVIPGNESSPADNPLSRSNSLELTRFAFNGRDTVLLRYSQPKWGDCYRAYEIFVMAGKVVERRAYWYWD